jgi:hypothetical protein
VTAKLYGITLDCADPVELGEFYSQLAGMEVAFSSEKYVGLTGPNGTAMSFQRVENFRAPQWPDQSVPQQLHLDFIVEDLDESEAEAIKLGATCPAEQPDAARWRVLLDPAGHPFCLAKMSAQ